MALELDDDFVGPVHAPPGEGPAPVQPEELAKRKSGWRHILDNLQDPNVQAALMQTGIGLMRSPRYGESGWDVAANALQTGVSTLDQLRQRQMAQKIAAEERQQKVIQQGKENVRGDRQVAATEQNAATNARSVDANIEQGKAAGTRGDRALTETERSNRAKEAIDQQRANSDAARATAYAQGRAGKTAAEIEKLNRLQKYYIDKEGLDPVDADKKALDYLATSKGKSPRQLVIEQFQKKVQAWMDNQFDPEAKLPVELREQFKKEAMEEVRTFDEAGREISDNRGTIDRPTVPSANGLPPVPGPNDPAMAGLSPEEQAAANRPAVDPKAPTVPSEATKRSIDAWKARGASPEQIKILIATGGENPSIYGY